jgi:hypothetical protein
MGLRVDSTAVLLMRLREDQLNVLDSLQVRFLRDISPVEVDHYSCELLVTRVST